MNAGGLDAVPSAAAPRARRGHSASWPRRLAVTVLVAVAGATVLVTGIATPAFAGSLVSPGWAVSATAPGALGVDYAYTFTTASTSELDSVTMTVPDGTSGSPAVGTVTPAGLADGGSVALTGSTLTYSFTPGTVIAGTTVSIEITGLGNTTVAGSYPSGHRHRRCGHAGGLGDHAGGQLLRRPGQPPVGGVGDRPGRASN